MPLMILILERSKTLIEVSDICQHYMTLPKDNLMDINSFKQGDSERTMRQPHPNLVGNHCLFMGTWGWAFSTCITENS